MIEMLAGFIISLVSLLIGFNLGKWQYPLSPQVDKRIRETFSRVVPKDSGGVGAVERPTARDIYLRDHPQAKEEQEVMGGILEKAINE